MFGSCGGTTPPIVNAAYKPKPVVYQPYEPPAVYNAPSIADSQS